MSKNSQFSLRPEWCMGLGKSSRFNFGFLDDRTVTYAVANTIVSMDVVSGKSRCSSLLTSLVDYTFTQGAFILCISSLVDKHRHFHLIDAKTNLVGSLDEVESNATLIDVSFEADNRFVIACLCGTSESSWISLLRNGQWTRFRQDQTPKQVLLKDGLIILTQDRISSYLIGADTSLTPHWNFEFKSDSLNRMSWLNDTSLLIGDKAGQIFQMDVNQTEQSHLVHNIRDELIKLEKQLALYAESNKRTSKLNLIDLADDSEPCEEDATCDESQTIDSAGNLFDVTIRHINQILNGFVCVCGANKLAVFKKDSLNQYKLTSVAQLPHNLDNFKSKLNSSF